MTAMSARSGSSFRRPLAAPQIRYHWTPPACCHHADEPLFLLATRVRAFLEPIWIEWHRARGGDTPAPLSRYTCGRSSLFLKHVLESEVLPGQDRPRGYFGFHTGSDWCSHAWVEFDGRILDITADQFGDAPVIVAATPDPRYHKAVSDSAGWEFDHARSSAVDRLHDRWLGWLERFRIDG